MVFLLTWFLHQDYLSLVVTYWQPQYFRFFQSPSFLFSHQFCTTEFWAEFWWHWFCGIYGPSSLSPLQTPSLLCLSFSQSTVLYRRSYFSGRNTWSIASPWLQSPSFQQQSSFLFGSKHFLLPPHVSWLLGVGLGMGLFSWRDINSSSMYVTLLINSPKF